MTTTTTSKLLSSSFKEAQQLVAQQALSRNVTLCGDLACQHDSFRRTMESATLVSLCPFQEEAAPTKKKKKKKPPKEQSLETQGTTGATHRYTMVLSDSIFFPAGGGQPSDRGTVTLLNSNGKDGDETTTTIKSNQWAVADAQNVNGICVLTCHATTNHEDATMQRLLQDDKNDESTTPLLVQQDIDWTFRLEIMCQHSAQHLISAIAINDLDNLQTHSFRLGQDDEEYSYIDFVVDANDSLEELGTRLQQLETLVNDAIRSNLPMTPTWLDPKSENFQRKVRSRLLPAGLTGNIRLMEIGDDGSVDCNTCCGTHVPSLGHLQMVKFFKHEKVKSTIWRVYFAAGPRLRKTIQAQCQVQSQLTQLLSCSKDDHVRRVAALLDDQKSQERAMKGLYEELAASRAKEIMAILKKNDNVAVVELTGLTATMSFMTMLSSTVLKQVDESSNHNVLLLFLAPSSTGDNDNEAGSFLLTGSNAAMVDASLGKAVAECLGGRGGGRNGTYQGKATQLKSGLDRAKVILMEAKAKTGS